VIAPAAPSRSLESLDSRSLLRLEKEIADSFMGGLPWGAVVWGLGNFAFWLSLWPLTLTGLLPIWAAFPLATVSIALCYLPSHEAQHWVIARPGERLYWLNELVGHLSIVPLLVPFRAARLTHFEHHLHANHPELDPDIGNQADRPWTFLKRAVANRQPRAKAAQAYSETLKRLGTPEAEAALRDAAIAQLTYLAVLFAMAWTGHALEAALLWWLPRHIAFTYLLFFLSWAPHHPHNEQGRYRDTRAFRSRLGNLLSMGMQFHIVHHLYPRIPLMRTPAAYWALRPVLEARGCDVREL
jgi:beta-carotene hydroxylase